MGMIETLAAFLVTLLVLITVHEFGHFYVAKLSGVKVLRFSIGFGKPIWQKRFGSDKTELVLAMLPLGGYVKMLDEREAPVPHNELHRAFNNQTLFKRFAIVSAGPLANFILAILLFTILNMVGMTGMRPYVDSPAKGTVADSAGLQAGELITEVDAQKVASWSDLEPLLVEKTLSEQKITLQVQDGSGHIALKTLDLFGFDLSQAGQDLIKELGITPWNPPLEAVVDQILPDSPAAKAGLEKGDKFISVNNQPVLDWQALVKTVQSHANQELIVQVERAKQIRQIKIIPEAFKGPDGLVIGRIGVMPMRDIQLINKLRINVKYPLGQAVIKSVDKTWDVTALTFKTFGMMLVGKASWKSIGGPVQIAGFAGETAKLGIVPFLSFVALISISLGALNLLPIPVLDGGYLLYYVVELLKGSPVPDSFIAFTQKIGLVLLTALMAFALYNDIHRLFTN
ncbi:MAG: RIP metalloprotease RseP [Ferrovum sp. 37-45-19]|jgi:regulator of sigma E protease|nr:regulator of sigma-E protease RseP [Ferrovum sp. JA12]OYV80691.1 MAG: RIP metalloprotease RseP [Ferrovum sp. 21-44-67]OYV95242.1 MAG: RIP metalloprotease RseP [Ferrovum sp. 37-45-19]HQT80745.1 RIP metalloprotease RseP [Ferrovaceae bacterium]HQU05955.1 RIP metalloprotease RseP [Ferrovaceae bacterium]